MWRTGSTYFWNKFREQSRYRAYYEPLNEQLLDASEAPQVRDWHEGSSKHLRHPDLKESYFAEYQPCLEGGTRLRRHYVHDYCLEKDDTDDFLRDYITDLVTFALAEARVPVLQFNRALMRTGWLTAQFNPINVLLLRRPVDVWKSFVSYKANFFPASVAMIVGRNQYHPLLRGILEHYAVPSFPHESWKRERELYRQYANANLKNFYPLFYTFYLLTSIAAARHADCIIDLNEVSANIEVRDLTTRKLRTLGMSISFDDCSLPMYPDTDPDVQQWLSCEWGTREFLIRNLPEQLQIPSSRFEIQRDNLGRYFRDIFEDFVLMPESLGPAPNRA